MKKVLISLAVIAVLFLGARVGFFWLLLNYPQTMKIVSQLADPIGPTQEVAWQQGPATAAMLPNERPPNVIVVLVDDLGINDLSWQGGGVAGGTMPTPHIDSLARDGADFTAGYAGNGTCAPSRAALMTGRYPTRFGFESTPAPPSMGKFSQRFQAEAEGENYLPPSLFHGDLVDQIPPMEEQGMPESEITVAELLQARGYHTAMFGKWHLGDAPGIRPEDQGFDEVLGFYSGGSMFGDEDDPEIVSARIPFDPIDNFVWSVLPFAVRYNGGARFTPSEYMTDYLTNAAVSVIEANRNQPFFLYLAYNAPHNPLQTTRADYDALSHIDDHATRVYAGMIRGVDRGVGKVMAALEEHGLSENTLILFSSDNGGAHYIGVPGLNDPYRGWKMTFFEGGIRSPFFAKWPARIPAGTVVEGAVSHIDVLPTVASAAGAPLPDDRPIDGVDLLPWAEGRATAAPHEALFWRSGHYQIVQAGGWKLQRNGRAEGLWLHDLNVDPTERKNLVTERPDKTAELLALLDAKSEELGPPAFPALVEAVIPIDRTLKDPSVEGEAFVYWPN